MNIRRQCNRSNFYTYTQYSPRTNLDKTISTKSACDICLPTLTQTYTLNNPVKNSILVLMVWICFYSDFVLFESSFVSACVRFFIRLLQSIQGRRLFISNAFISNAFMSNTFISNAYMSNTFISKMPLYRIPLYRKYLYVENPKIRKYQESQYQETISRIESINIENEEKHENLT